jgi:hypothetical protein
MGRSDEFSVGASPVPEIAAGAARYRAQNGLAAPEQDYSKSLINPAQSRVIAAHYAAMPSYNKAAEPAYRAMAEETGRQFDHMTSPRSKGGMGLSVGVSKEDPYGTHDGKYSYEHVMSEMSADVQGRNHVDVLSAASTGGHPFFTNDQNEMFRAVHDVFGHLGSGRGIDFNGEEGAYQKHAAMYSPLARGALASETRGQNSSLRMTGEFPEQKVGVLPAHLSIPRNLSGAQFSDVQLARQKNAEQGL